MEEKQKTKKTSKISYIIIIIMLIVVAIALYNRFEEKNFNDFVRTEYMLYASQFERDSDVTYFKKDSYKITSTTPNDAMFYKEVKVTPNTPYKVTCMVKTKEVKTQKDVSIGGAHISIADTVEKSKSITGTKDWQKLEFIFNSKARTSVKLGFRLGGYDDNCTGTAWFSDFTIEAGYQAEDTNWKFACFIFTNTDVTLEENGAKKDIKLAMNTSDVADMRQNMARFKTSCQELSKGKMSVDYDVMTIQEPITSLSYDNENGYYVAPENIQDKIQTYIEGENYDHIFVCLRLGDNEHQNDIPVYDWIGLGGMDYLGIGFSNIRLPNSSRSYTYKYNSRINTFPEEVFIHEFLHSLERTAKEYGLERPALHDYAKYGYQEERLEGLKKWYQDYMNQMIKTSSGNIGLDKKVYTLQPNHEDDFIYSYQLNEFKEPNNIIEKIRQIIFKAFDNVTIITKKKEGNNIS
ncbi:MAG: hypothetical protein HFJ27_04645 [Clostridia bacterium]|nr:hypothetical protein [Clostridia bacterium]